MKRLLLVMNPRSGKKRANGCLAEIIGIFNRGGYDVSTYMTAARGDATEIVKARGGEFDCVVCVGGDGTFNEVVSGLCDGGLKTPIGYIPAGSTNDFANSLHLSKNILEAAQDIVDGTPHTLDVGRFGTRHFSYVASFGAFARTSYSTPQSVKNTLGHLAYILGGIKEIPTIRAKQVRFETAEGEIFEDKYLFGAISNSTSVGGILTLDPEIVDMNDGVFELLLIKSPANVLELHECIRALTKKDYSSKMITFCTTRSVTITADPEMEWTLDGEQELGHETVTAENLHDAISVLVNEKEASA